MLAEPPFLLLDAFEKIDHAIDVNAILAENIAACGIEDFGLPIHPEPETSVNWHGAATPDDISKAHSTIRQLYRDWSAQGGAERSLCYDPVLLDLQKMLPDRPRNQFKALVPGAGLGRLVYEICCLGYNVEGNEISWHQLLTSSWILNRTDHQYQHDLFPFALQFTNLVSRRDQLQQVKIPDTHPGLGMANLAGTGAEVGSMNMTAADFVSYYKLPSQESTFNAVVTVFFIDTAPNLIRYIETVRHCLTEDGVWINLGPLHWHFDARLPGSDHGKTSEATPKASRSGTDVQHGGIEEPGSFELSNEEVITLVERMGFHVEQHRIENVGVGYIQNPESMLQDSFRPSHWIARKIRRRP